MPNQEVKIAKNGLAESIHFLMAYAETELSELKQKVEKWLEEEEKEGKLDCLHGLAVARCIGSSLGLLSGDHWVDAQLDTIAIVIYEILKKTQQIFNEPDEQKREKLKAELKKEILETYFKSFEKTVEENGGNFSKKLSWVDIFFVGAVNVLEWYLGISLVDNKFPYLMKLIKFVYSIPQIKKYVDERRKAFEGDVCGKVNNLSIKNEAKTVRA